MEIKLIDLVQEYNQEVWRQFKESVLSSSHRLRQNYIEMSVSDFYSLTALSIDGEFYCLSGLQLSPSKWTPFYGRVNSRMWVNPKFRSTLLSSIEKKNAISLHAKYCLRKQIEIGSALGLSGVFISREGDYRRTFLEYNKVVKKETGYDFKLLDHKYNICGNLDSVPCSCKQLISVLEFGSNKWEEDLIQFQI